MDHSAIVRLVNAGLITQDGVVYGALVVERTNGEHQIYGLHLPTETLPNPPGWSAIVRSSGVSLEEIRNGWNLYGSDNPVAREALGRFSESCVGKTFFSRVEAGPEGKAAIELLDLTPEAPRALRHESVRLGAEAVPPPAAEIIETKLVDVHVNVDPAGAVPPYITVETESGHTLDVGIPDAEGDPDPYNYWQVEVITEVFSTQVAGAWQTPKNGAAALGRVNPWLGTIRGRLRAALVPVTIRVVDGVVDLDDIRKTVVRSRFHGAKKRPKVAMTRSVTATAQIVWKLMGDIAGDFCFRYGVKPGISSGYFALVCDSDGLAKLQIVKDHAIMELAVNRHIDFVTPGKRDVKPYADGAPRHIIRDMLTASCTAHRMIESLTRIPTIRRDGTVVKDAGYDAASRAWYAPEFSVDTVPDDPTNEDVQRALSTITVPFQDFPFAAGGGGEAGVLACLLEQIVRPMIYGPRPMYAFDAPAFRGMSSGKTLLAQTIGSIVTGQHVPVTPWPDDKAEFAKIATTKLLHGEPFVIFDNLEGTLKNKDLAAVMTSPTWTMRLLHKNEAPDLPQTATWCVTLNGATFSRDIARRTVLIRLKTREADPFKRKSEWVIEDLIPYCIEHRPEIIRACLVLARSWVVAGRPRPPWISFPSFEAWTRVVWGILHHVGVTALPATITGALDRDVDTQEHDTFMRHWIEEYPQQPVTLPSLVNIAERYGLYPEVLSQTNATWRGRKLGGIVKGLLGYDFEGWTPTQLSTLYNGYQQYMIERTVPDAAPTAPLLGNFPN